MIFSVTVSRNSNEINNGDFFLIYIVMQSVFHTIKVKRKIRRRK